MLNIDCSKYQNQGRIKRMAFALAAITKKSCRFFNIKQKDKKTENFTSFDLYIEAVSQLCNGYIENSSNQELVFSPGNEYKNSLSLNVSPNENIILLLQDLLLSLVPTRLPIEITIKGGFTDALLFFGIDYFQEVFLKLLKNFGIKTELDIIKRGYRPEGGAHIKIIVHPSNIGPILLTERGSLKKILIISGASESLKIRKVAESQLSGTKEILGKLNLPIEEKIKYYQTLCPGNQICLVSEFENTIIGINNIGKWGERAKDLGKEAALKLLNKERVNSCLDQQISIQLLPYLALSCKKSQIRVSEIINEHKEVIRLIEKFTDNKCESNSLQCFNGNFKIEENLIKWTPK